MYTMKVDRLLLRIFPKFFVFCLVSSLGVFYAYLHILETQLSSVSRR